MRSWLVVCLLSAIVSPTILFAKDEAEFIFTEGQDHFYNAEYIDPASDFDRYIESKPDDPLGYWRKAYSLYFKWKQDQHRVFPKLNNVTRRDFYRLLAIGIQKTNADIAAKKDVDFAFYVKACLLSMRGGVEAGTGKMALLTARDTLEKALEAASQSRYQDAHYLAGLTNYNGSFHSFWFAIAGLPHNREEGMKMIYNALDGNNGPFVDDVEFVLLSIKTDPRNASRFSAEEAGQIGCPLLAKYPRNPVLLRSYSEICASRND